MIALRVVGIRHLVAAVGGARDRVGVTAEAERRPGLLHGGEPGLIDELIEALARRSVVACAAGLKFEFDPARSPADNRSSRRSSCAAWRMAPAICGRCAIGLDQHGVAGVMPCRPFRAKAARHGLIDSAFAGCAEHAAIMVNESLTASRRRDGRRRSSGTSAAGSISRTSRSARPTSTATPAR